jgi:hypothetical protein
VSHLHHGRPGHPEEERVHSIYETNMLDRFRAELITGINTRLDGLEITTHFLGGQAAANASVQLMAFTIEQLPPIQVIEAYNAHEGAHRLPHMWSVLKDRSIECMAEGTLYLAEMWQSAWREGGGDQIPHSKLKAQSRSALRNLYLKKTWVESDWLRNMEFSA